MKVIIYTDGSARSNPGRGGYGAVLKYTNPAGEILSIKTPGGSRFDRTIEPHAHIICTSCSRVIDVPLPFDAQLDAKASEQIGWHVTALHHLRGSLPRLPIDVWDMP